MQREMQYNSNVARMGLTERYQISIIILI